MTNTRKDLLALPMRKLDEEKTYPSIVLVPTGKKHKSSGSGIIAVIGLYRQDGLPEEIAGYSDDVRYYLAEDSRDNPFNLPILHTDAIFYPSGFIHVWSMNHYFKIIGTKNDIAIQLVPRGFD